MRLTIQIVGFLSIFLVTLSLFTIKVTRPSNTRDVVLYRIAGYGMVVFVASLCFLSEMEAVK